MAKINWAVRLKNKTFWVSLIPLAFVFAHQVLALFGVDFDYTIISEQLVQIVETAFLILGLLGVVVDPTTAGVSDSARALTYTEPK
jgi:phi LC3 family holin